MRLHSLEFGEKRAQPCPNCRKGGLEYQCEDATDGDTYRCVACRCWTNHAPLTGGGCGMVVRIGRNERHARCELEQERLPLETRPDHTDLSSACGYEDLDG